MSPLRVEYLVAAGTLAAPAARPRRRLRQRLLRLVRRILGASAP